MRFILTLWAIVMSHLFMNGQINCTTATQLTCGTTVTGNNVGGCSNTVNGPYCSSSDNSYTGKEKIYKLCKHVHQTFLMPQFSPYLQFSEDEEYYYFVFNHKKMPFLKEDVTLMPLTNITVEELSRWFLSELIKEKDELDKHRLEKIVVKIFSAPGQSASHEWQRT